MLQKVFVGHTKLQQTASGPQVDNLHYTISSKTNVVYNPWHLICIVINRGRVNFS
jgi:hypothetical protein